MKKHAPVTVIIAEPKISTFLRPILSAKTHKRKLEIKSPTNVDIMNNPISFSSNFISFKYSARINDVPPNPISLIIRSIIIIYTSLLAFNSVMMPISSPTFDVIACYLH